MRLSFKIPILGSLDFLGSTTGFWSISGVFVGVRDDETGGDKFIVAGVGGTTSLLFSSFRVGGGSRGVSVGGE
jgi:hypothetical protein